MLISPFVLGCLEKMSCVILHMRKQRRRSPAKLISCENKDADQLRSFSAKLISAFVFATRIVQSLYFLNPKFQTWFVSDLVRNPEDRFSHNEARIISLVSKSNFKPQAVHPSSCLTWSETKDRFSGNEQLVRIPPSSEPCHVKTCIRGFRPGPIQTGLCSHRRLLEA